tara:strand:+ start:127 stop:546 length:420 start_codon:yes stop_codon:yes gene_type:complete
MIKIAHEKITAEASGTMETSWKVWFGKKIMGTRYIENIAADKVEAAKRAAEEIIPGLVCRTIKQLLSIFCIVTFGCSCMYLFIFYISGELYSGDDLFGYRIALSVLGFLFYSILLYKFLNDGLESITKGVENGIKSAAR